MNLSLSVIEPFLQRLAPHVLAVLLAWGFAFLPRQMPAVMSICAIVILLLTQGRVLADGWQGLRARPLSSVLFSAQGAAVGLMAYIAASAVWSASPRADEMLRDITLVAASAFVLASVSHSWGADFTRRLMGTLAVTFTVALFLFSLNVYLDFPYQRLTGMAIPAGYVGYWESNVPKRSSVLFAIFAWPVALYLWQTQRRTVALALLALTAFTLLHTYGRAAMVGSVAGLGVCLVGLWRVRLAQLAGFLFLPLSFVLVLAFALVELEHIRPIIRPVISDSGDQRLFIWNFAGYKAVEHMPFGIGLDGSRVLPNDTALPAVPYQDGDQLPDHPHNVLLQLWLELGLVGAGLASFLLLCVWRSFSRAPRNVQPLLWGYTVCAVLTLAIAYGAWQSWWLGSQAVAALLMARVLQLQPPSES